MILMRTLVFALAAMTVLMAGCDHRDSGGAPAVGTNTVPSTTVSNAVGGAAPANSALARLVGKWQRGDGDYVIEVKSVGAAGKLDAAYFNPNPIHVSKAMALTESAGLKVFIELQDTGYPGCTYSLQYDPATDQLFGQYFQAAQQQTYDVAFARLKE
jgi:uncharacterized protein (DUF2147 family)